jgi:hypothetical protein
VSLRDQRSWLVEAISMAKEIASQSALFPTKQSLGAKEIASQSALAMTYESTGIATLAYTK